MDKSVRDRMRCKSAWNVVWEVALGIMRHFRILVVLCNHGKHRSLSVAYDIADYLNCELVSPRNHLHTVRLKDVPSFLSYLTPRLNWHREVYGRASHPLVSIGVCNCDFDGPEWVRKNHANTEGICADDLHIMRQGDVIVQLDPGAQESAGWGYGSVIHEGGGISRLWFHPGKVEKMRNWYYAKVKDLEASLKWA